jgi:peptidoglycan/LPS O-acetylase OafA/YrhL
MQVAARAGSARPETDAAGSVAPAGGGGRGPVSLGYVPGLDGLRAFAVTAVLLYHDDLTWIPGGFLGVEVFFVISGYLITSLLLAEWRNTGGISLRAFYLRRARRLLPALFAVLAVASLFALLFLPDDVAKLRGDVVAALTYSTNWYQIFHNQSYFEFVGRPSLFEHLWSLAVEEQFYVVWPVLFTGLLKLWGRDRRKLLGAILGGALLSSILMAVLYKPLPADPTRVYIGTDTRAAGLLIGAALALVWAPWRLSKRVPPGGRYVLDALGAIGVVVLALFMIHVHDFSSGLYRGGFLVVSIATAIVIAVAVHPAADFGKVFGIPPLRWIGMRSYGLYLWHWPVYMVTRPHLDIDLTGYPLLFLRLAITTALAEVSYRYVEQPIRHGWIGDQLKTMRQAKGDERMRLASRALAVTGAITLVVVLIVVGLANGRAPAPPPGLESAAASATQPTPTTVATTPGATQPGGGTATTQPVAAPSVDAVGDSVMLGAKPQLEALGNVYVDAAVSRQFPAIIQIFKDLRDQGRLAEVAVVHTGTNGFVTAGQFDELMDVLKNTKRVIIFNTKVPRRWEGPNNATINDVVSKYQPKARLVDWNKIGNAHPEWFYDDGIHLRPAGREAYAQLIQSAR